MAMLLTYMYHEHGDTRYTTDKNHLQGNFQTVLMGMKELVIKITNRLFNSLIQTGLSRSWNLNCNKTVKFKRISILSQEASMSA